MKNHFVTLLFVLFFFGLACNNQKEVKPISPAQLNEILQSQESMNINYIPDSLQGFPPDFNAEDLYGNKFTLSSQKGKVVVLNFWGTWCAPCIAEIPEFIELQEHFGKEDLIFVGISTPNEPEENVKEFTEEMGINYTIVYDDDQEIIKSYSPHSWPSTYIIGQDGKIKKFIIGSTNKKLLLPELDKLL